MTATPAGVDRFWGARARPVPPHVRAAVEAFDPRLFIDWNPRALRYEFLYLRNEPDSLAPRPMPPWGFNPITGKRHRDLSMCMAIQDPDGWPRVPTANDLNRLRLSEFKRTWEEIEAELDAEDEEQERKDSEALSDALRPGHEKVWESAVGRVAAGWQPFGARHT